MTRSTPTTGRALGARPARSGQGRQRQPDPSFKDRVVIVAQSRPAVSASAPSPARPPETRPGRGGGAAHCGGRSRCGDPVDLGDGKVVTAATYGAARGQRQLRRRQPFLLELIGDPLTADWGFVNVNLRRTTPRARRRSATRSPSSSVGACRSRVISPIASGSPAAKVDGVPRVRAARSRAGHAVQRLRSAGHGLLAGVGGVPRGHDVVRPQRPNTPSPSRSPSATLLTAPTRSTPYAAPAGSATSNQYSRATEGIDSIAEDQVLN